MNIGIKFENQIIKQLTDEGYIAVRSHLSRVVDIIAYNDSETLFIEAKATRNKRPYSYVSELRNSIELCKKNGCRDIFMFVIKLKGNKQIWVNLNTMTLDERTTYNNVLATKWLERKKHSLGG